MARFITCVTIDSKKTVKVYEGDRYVDVISQIYDDITSVNIKNINYIRNMDNDQVMYMYNSPIHDGE